MIRLHWGQANVHSGKCLFGLLSVRLLSGWANVYSPWVPVWSGYCPVGLLSSQVTVRSGYCLLGKCPSSYCLLGMCPRGSVHWVSVRLGYCLDIYGIYHWMVLLSSYRTAWVGFELTTTEFHSDTLTNWAIRPWVKLAPRVNFVQLLKFSRLLSVRFHFGYCLCQLPCLF